MWFPSRLHLRKHNQSSGTGRRTYRPRLEPLEVRAVPSFGVNGRVLTDVAGTTGERAYAVAVQADGKIVAAGPGAIARYNADGSLDATFNPTGSQPGIVPAFNGDILDMLVQPDGKIVAAGSRVVDGSIDALLLRYTANGSPDPTFGTNGAVASNFKPRGKDSDTDEFRAVALQSDGKIVAAGRINYLSKGGGWGLARYNANGTPDTSFDGDGWLTTSWLANDYRGVAVGVALQPDGKIVAAGRLSATSASVNDHAVARYNSNGSLDASFGVGGKVRIDFGPEFGLASTVDEAHALALQSDGKILVAGMSDDQTTYSLNGSVLRLNASGTLDTSFGGNGRVAVKPPDFYRYTEFNGVTVQNDGKIVAVASYGNAVVRFNLDGSLDPSFDGDGWKQFGYATENPTNAETWDFTDDVAVQSDGRIAVAGSLLDHTSGSSRIGLARFDPDGSFDDETAAILSAGMAFALAVAKGPAPGGAGPAWAELRPEPLPVPAVQVDGYGAAGLDPPAALAPPVSLLSGTSKFRPSDFPVEPGDDPLGPDPFAG